MFIQCSHNAHTMQQRTLLIQYTHDELPLHHESRTNPRDRHSQYTQETDTHNIRDRHPRSPQDPPQILEIFEIDTLK